MKILEAPYLSLLSIGQICIPKKWSQPQEDRLGPGLLGGTPDQEDSGSSEGDGEKRSSPVGLRVVRVAAEAAPLRIKVDDRGLGAVVLDFRQGHVGQGSTQVGQVDWKLSSITHHRLVPTISHLERHSYARFAFRKFCFLSTLWQMLRPVITWTDFASSRDLIGIIRIPKKKPFCLPKVLFALKRSLFLFEITSELFALTNVSQSSWIFDDVLWQVSKHGRDSNKKMTFCK